MENLTNVSTNIRSTDIFLKYEVSDLDLYFKKMAQKFNNQVSDRINLRAEKIAHPGTNGGQPYRMIAYCISKDH